MLNYPDINPIALTLGPFYGFEGFSIRWYGLTYLVGISMAFFYCWVYRNRVEPRWSTELIIDLFFYGVIGVIFGGTLGYVLFYDPMSLVVNPSRILCFWEPGRAFHGGLIGVGIAIIIFARRQRRSFLSITDFIVPGIPLGLGAGRIGNFLNGELWGRVTAKPWGMVFPHAGPFPRHPSQLYEFMLEGIILFIVLYCYTRKPRPLGRATALFVMGYGCARFFIEFYREPDLPIGFVALNWVTMGQMLSIPMILAGLLIWWNTGKRSQLCNNI